MLLNKFNTLEYTDKYCGNKDIFELLTLIYASIDEIELKHKLSYLLMYMFSISGETNTSDPKRERLLLKNYIFEYEPIKSKIYTKIKKARDYILNFNLQKQIIKNPDILAMVIQLQLEKPLQDLFTQGGTRLLNTFLNEDNKDTKANFLNKVFDILKNFNKT
jgi:hypothetical protein